MVAMTLALLLASCGSHQSGAVGTGSVSFQVDWENPPASAAGASLAPNIDVCTDYGIQTVTMQVLKDDTVTVQADFACADHAGTMTNVPAGDNLVLRLRASVAGVGVVWVGQTDNTFNLAPSEAKNLGKITMGYTGGDHVSPSATIVPADGTLDFPDNSAVVVTFSEKMALHTVVYDCAVLLIDNITGHPVTGSRIYDNNAFSLTFTPDAAMTGGRKYNMVLDNGTITDMAGNRLDKRYVAEFTVHLRGSWETPARVDTGLGANRSTADMSSVVALDDAGNATLAWKQRNTSTGEYGLYSSRRPAAAWAWENAQVIDDGYTPIDSFSKLSGLGLDNAGNVLAIWNTSDANRYIRKKWFLVGAGWQPSFTTVTGGFYCDAIKPLVMNRKGNALVPFLTKGTSGTGTQHFRTEPYRNGTWSTPLDVDNNSDDLAVLNGAAAINVNDNAVAAYSKFDGVSTYRLYAKVLSTWGGGGWGFSPVLLDSNTPSALIGNIEAAMDKGGNAMVVWTEYVMVTFPPPAHVWANRYDNVTKTWGGAVRLTLDSLTAVDDYPKIAVDGNGVFTVVWQNTTLGLTQYSVYARRFDPVSKTWGPQSTNILPAVSTLAPNPEIAANDKGDVAVAWLYASAGMYRIGATLNAGGTWGTPAYISGTGVTTGIRYHAVAINKSGNAVVVWLTDGTTSPQTPDSAWASRYW